MTLPTVGERYVNPTAIEPKLYGEALRIDEAVAFRILNQTKLAPYYQEDILSEKVYLSPIKITHLKSTKEDDWHTEH